MLARLLMITTVLVYPVDGTMIGNPSRKIVQNGPSCAGCMLGSEAGQCLYLGASYCCTPSDCRPSASCRRTRPSTGAPECVFRGYGPCSRHGHGGVCITRGVCCIHDQVCHEHASCPTRRAKRLDVYVGVYRRQGMVLRIRPRQDRADWLSLLYMLSQ